MKMKLILLLFTGISFISNAQQSIEARMQQMYNALNAHDLDNYIREYMYAEVFDIIHADTLTKALKSIYATEMYDMKLSGSDFNNISKIITHDGIQYAFVKNKSAISFHLKRDYYVKDSIETAQRYDSLRLAMEVDTEYQAFLKKYNDDNYEYVEGEKGIWDFPYFELPDSTDVQMTVTETMENALDLFVLGMLFSIDKKEMKKIKYDTDKTNMIFTIDNFAENGSIAFINPKHSSEWQFIANNKSNPMLMNYLVPIEVRKKLKIK